MMTFEYVIVCNTEFGASSHKSLADLLVEALETSVDEFDDDDIGRMIDVRHKKTSHSDVCTHEACNCNWLVGFALELPVIDALDEVLDQFTTSLSHTGSVYHVLKFEDPLLQEELADWAAEIFTLEMKLRRVLSIIYLYAYQYRDPYNLLRNDKVRPMTSDLTDEDMATHSENQFFHLSFRDYISLNDRSKLQLPDIVRMIRDSDNYDHFRGEVTRPPIQGDRDVDLLSDLKALMDPIERMRNCVAHNRTPSARVRESYRTTRNQIEDRLERYMSELVRA